MKIAMVSKANSSGGGASKVADDLTFLLNQYGYYVDHFTRSKHKQTIPLYTDFEKKIYHRLLNMGIQEYYPFEKKVLKKYNLSHKYDIFHFHDITSAISPLTIKYLSDNNKKIIWTIHDCSVVTGGCINPLECHKYKATCHNCPQLSSFGLGRNFDFTFIFHNIKKYSLKNSNIHFVAPSKWIADLVYNTGYIKNYPTIISNGVDTNIFKPLNKDKVRMELNLPTNRFILLLSSASLSNKYKGLNYAFDVIHKLKEINPFVLIVGSKNIEIEKELIGVDFYCTGYINDKKILNKYYSSADVFLNTTIADNQPLTVLESMASGTPNFGFATGGISEIITQGIDGFLVKNHNVSHLATAISKFYNNDKLRTMSEKSNQKIIKNYSISIFIKNYITLYKDLFLKLL